MDLLKSNYSQFYTNFTGKTNLKLVGSEDWYSSHVTPLDNFFNTYYIFSKNLNFSNLRWFGFIDLDQKFSKMFTSSSTQQRVLAN